MFASPLPKHSPYPTFLILGAKRGLHRQKLLGDGPSQSAIKGWRRRAGKRVAEENQREMTQQQLRILKASTVAEILEGLLKGDQPILGSQDIYHAQDKRMGVWGQGCLLVAFCTARTWMECHSLNAPVNARHAYEHGHRHTLCWTILSALWASRDQETNAMSVNTTFIIRLY